LSLGDDPLRPPYLCLLASGGHTLLLDVARQGELVVLGGTLDDAAGEAFDKGARLLGLGFPGGPALAALAEQGDDQAVHFPRAMAGRAGCGLSFSGLKTALAQRVRAEPDLSATARADLAASYERALVETLVERTLRGLELSGRRTLALVGGVAANT